ncbi:MAG: rhomboid family intramembrane serine protease, partial [Planctomycetota bacterium]
MGIYDREYARGSEPGFHLQAPQTATTQLVILTFGVYVLQLLFSPYVTNALALRSDWFVRPWQFYQLLTYGFLHSEKDVVHILVNMVVLWMFGREIEYKYGRRQFVAFYLTAIVFAGVAWSLIEAAYGYGADEPPRMVGASGGISGVVALFALNFPHRQVLLMFVIPMPMWVAAVIALLLDAHG